MAPIGAPTTGTLRMDRLAGPVDQRRDLQDKIRSPMDHWCMQTDKNTPTSLVPRLVVADPDRPPSSTRRPSTRRSVLVSRCPMARSPTSTSPSDAAQISLTTEVKDWGLDSPHGSSPVLLRLTVDDARSARDRMVDAGAEELVPVEGPPLRSLRRAGEGPVRASLDREPRHRGAHGRAVRGRLTEAYGGS